MRTSINLTYSIFGGLFFILGLLTKEIPLNGISLLIAAGLILAVWNARNWYKKEN